MRKQEAGAQCFPGLRTQCLRARRHQRLRGLFRIGVLGLRVQRFRSREGLIITLCSRAVLACLLLAALRRMCGLNAHGGKEQDKGERGG
jgi:hypothetical protein